MNAARLAALAALCMASASNAQEGARPPSHPIDWRPQWIAPSATGYPPSPYMQQGWSGGYAGWGLARRTGPDVPVPPVVTGAATSPRANEIQIPSPIGDRYVPGLSPCWAGGEYCDASPRLQILLVPSMSQCAPPFAGDCTLMR